MALLRKKIKLDLDGIPKTDHNKVKDEVGNYLINQVLRDMERGFSPVEGEGQFKLLNPDYARDEKGGRRTANLELEGDLKDAIQFKRTTSGIEFGHYSDEQKDKADAHNQHSKKAERWAKSFDTPFPRRRYIPTSSQEFRADIENEIDNILNGFKTKSSRFNVTEGIVETPEELVTAPTVTIQNIFDDDFIAQEVRRQLEGDET